MNNYFKLGLIVITLSILTGCIDKSAIKTQIDHADQVVSDLKKTGYTSPDVEQMLSTARTWWGTYGQAESITSLQETTILTLVTDLQSRMNKLEKYHAAAFNSDVTTYMTSHPDRTKYWQFIAIGSVQIGMNQQEVTFINGKPESTHTFSEDRNVMERWYYHVSGREVALVFKEGYLVNKE